MTPAGLPGSSDLSPWNGDTKAALSHVAREIGYLGSPESLGEFVNQNEKSRAILHWILSVHFRAEVEIELCEPCLIELL